MERLLYPAQGAFTISTTWTSTGPFKTQTAAFASATILNDGGAVTREIYVGGGGTLGVIMFDGSTGLFPSVPGGTQFPVRAIALSSQNTATSLVGLY